MGRGSGDSGGGGMIDFTLGLAVFTMLLTIVALVKYIGGY